MDGHFIEGLQGRLEQVVGVRGGNLEVLAHIRSRSPARFEPRGEDLTLVALEVVVLILSRLDGRIERGCLAGEALLSSFSLELSPCLREKVGSFAGSFESFRM